MKILIAAGAGYVGSVLIPKLLDRGYKVDVVDLFWFGNHLPRQVGTINKDIFQLSVEDLEPYDQVIFLAGLSNDPTAEYSPSKNFIFDAAAPACLAYTAKNAEVKRYIYACSCSVYGYTENELYDETRISCWPSTRLPGNIPRRSSHWLHSSCGTGRSWSRNTESRNSLS